MIENKRLRRPDGKFASNQNSLLSQVENITIDEHEDESITIALVENTLGAQLVANLIKKIEARSRSRPSQRYESRHCARRC